MHLNNCTHVVYVYINFITEISLLRTAAFKVIDNKKPHNKQRFLHDPISTVNAAKTKMLKLSNKVTV